MIKITKIFHDCQSESNFQLKRLIIFNVEIVTSLLLLHAMVVNRKNKYLFTLVKFILMYSLKV